jgi:hypothetical protein
MYPLWAYDEVKQRQERAARAAERRAALRVDGEVGTAPKGRGSRLWTGRRSRSLAAKLAGGGLFPIPKSTVRDWRAS